MAYGDFTTIAKVEALGCRVLGADLTSAVPPPAPPPDLAATLARNRPLAILINTEAAKSQLLIAPLLVGLKFAHRDRLAFFTAVAFDVDPSRGLNDQLDFALSRDPLQMAIRAPVCVVAEAKNEELRAAIPQCLSAMVAARTFNDAAGLPPAPIYGAATNGVMWHFLKYDGVDCYADIDAFSIENPDKVYGVLTAMALGTPAI
jgi:hypothetical protein